MLQRNGQLLYKRFAGYLLPTLIMSVALSMSIVVDGIIVGNMLGAEALVAVNLVLPLTLLFTLVSALFGMGGTILVAGYLGRHEQETADEVFTLSLCALAVSGLLLGLILHLSFESLAALLTNGDPVLEPLVRDFLHYLAWATPFLIFTPGFVYFVRVDGWPVLASATLVTANVVNVIGDIVLIRATGGIQGASIATFIGYVAGTLLLLPYALSPRRGFHLRLPLSVIARRLVDTLKTGFPCALDNGLLFAKIACINAMVLSLAGASGMAAFSVCIACLSLVSIFIAGAADTMMPIAGVLYGEEDYQGIRFVFRRAMGIVLAASVVLLVIFEIAPHRVLQLFGVEAAEDLALGVPAVRIYALSFLGVSFTFMMLAYYQTIERSGLATAVSLVEGLVLIVPLAWILSRFWGLNGIWIAFVLTELGTFAFIWLCVRREEVKSQGRVKGLLLLPAGQSSGRALDLTIRNTLDEAVALSEEVRLFCLNQGLSPSMSNKVAVAVEELAVNVAKHGHDRKGKHYIDLGLRLTDESINISFRDDGRPFNPLLHMVDNGKTPTCKGLEVLQRLAVKLHYNYTLNFNATLIVIPRFAENNI